MVDDNLFDINRYSPEQPQEEPEDDTPEVSDDLFDINRYSREEPEEGTELIGPDFLQKPIAGTMRAIYQYQESSVMFGLLDDLFRWAVGAETREEQHAEFEPKTGTWIDPVIDVAAGIAGTITDFYTLGKLIGPIIGKIPSPDFIQPGLQFGSTRLARTGLQDISGDEIDPVDYARSGVSGFLAGEAGHLIGAGMKHLDYQTAGEIPKYIYPYIERGASGAGVGATFTAADAGFDVIFDGETDTSLADLGMNMASMAALYTLPVLKDDVIPDKELQQAKETSIPFQGKYGKHQGVKLEQLNERELNYYAQEAEEDWLQEAAQKVLTPTYKGQINHARQEFFDKKQRQEEVFSRIGVEDPASKEDITKRWQQLRRQFTQGNLHQLDESTKVKSLADIKRARDAAYDEIEDMTLSTKVKNAMKQKLDEVTTGISRRFTGTTSGDLVEVEQQMRHEPIKSVDDFIVDIQEADFSPEEVTDGELTTQEIAGLLAEPETDPGPAVPMPGETPVGDVIELPGEIADIAEQAGIELTTLDINKPLKELTDEELQEVRTHLRGKLDVIKETEDAPVIGGEGAVEKDLQLIDEMLGDDVDLTEQELYSEPIEPITQGITSEVVTPEDTEIETQFEIVEADDLITSHDTNLSEVDEFPDELQPRQRSKAATEEQIHEIYTELDPRRLGDNVLAQHGAPIIGPDGVVEVGNARTISLKRLFEDNHENAELYKNWLRENAEQFGITPEAIDQAENPVLVRERLTDVDREQFTTEANIEETARMSPAEQGVVDSRNITPELLDEFVPHEDGLINTADNQEFITDYLDQIVGTAQKGQYIDADGNLSQDGIRRIKSGIFAAAYDDPNILAELFESTDSTIKNITGAMMEVAPNVVQNQKMIEEGRLFDLDISQNLTNSVNLYKEIKAEDMPVSTYLNQISMFEERYTPIEKELVRMFEEHKYNRKKIREILNKYNELIRNVGRPDMDRMFGEIETPDKTQLLEQARHEIEGDVAMSQTNLTGYTANYEMPDPDNIDKDIPSGQMPDEAEIEIDGDKAKVDMEGVGEIEIDVSAATGQIDYYDTGGYFESEYDNLAIEMPEIVEIVKEINDGNYPHIKEELTKPESLGQFRVRDEEATIQLRGDIFIGPIVNREIVPVDEMDDMITQLQEDFPEDEGFIYETDTENGTGIIDVYQKDPTFAPKVMAHEIGHLVDWLPEKETARGNILGHVASLKKYMKHTLETEMGEINRDEIMEELRNVSEYWKPFDPEEVTEEFINYRFSPEELYADALSVLVNEPETLEDMAPTFYQSFNEYLDRKPEFKAIYEDVQRRLTNREKLNEDRLDDIYSSFERGREVRNEIREQSQQKPEGIMDSFMRYMVDANHVIYKHFDSDDPGAQEAAEQARYELEELAYIASEIDDYVYNLNERVIGPLVDMELEIDDLGAYMFFKRVINERDTMANPRGHTPETAQEQLETMRNRIGDEAFNRLEEVANDFNSIRQEKIIPRVDEAGLYPDELIDIMMDNENYAAFNVVDYLNEQYGEGVTSKIYEQIGTLADIENPMVATILKDMSMLRAAKYNEAKTSTIIGLQKNAPDVIEEAETEFNPHIGATVPKEPQEKGKELFTVMVDGEQQSYYIPEDIAGTFVTDTFKATKVSQVWHGAFQVLRDLFVSKNPAWMLRNIVRDMQGTIINNPEIRLRDIPKVLSVYKEAYKESWGEVMRQERPEDIAYMMNNHMLTSHRMYGSREKTYEDEIERVLDTFIRDIEYKSDEEVSTARRIVRKALDTADRLGRVSEVGGQVAGYKFLDEFSDLEGEDLGHRVRTRVGTPDYMRKGELQWITNNVWMYSNIGKEGFRRSKNAFQDDPASFLWKTLMINVLPKLAMMAAGAGYAGERIQKIFDGASEYDKRMYNIIPLHLDDTGRSWYFRIPQDHVGQAISSSIWSIAHGELTGQSGLTGQITQSIPWDPTQFNPFFEVGRDMIDYYGKDIIPTDRFRGREIISPYSDTPHRDFWRHQWGRLGGRTIYDPAFEHEDDTMAQMLRVFPFNALGSYLRISDYGFEEDINDLYQRRDELSRTVNRVEESLIQDGEMDISQEEFMEYQAELQELRAILNPISNIQQMIREIEESELPEEEIQERIIELKINRYNIARDYLDKEPLDFGE